MNCPIHANEEATHTRRANGTEIEDNVRTGMCKICTFHHKWYENDQRAWGFWDIKPIEAPQPFTGHMGE